MDGVSGLGGAAVLLELAPVAGIRSPGVETLWLLLVVSCSAVGCLSLSLLVRKCLKTVGFVVGDDLV